MKTLRRGKSSEWKRAGVRLAGSVLAALIAGHAADRLATIRVDAGLVLIPVTVTDTGNRPVTGLNREMFRVLDGEIERPVVQFSSEDAPVSVGIVFDSSGSMGDKLRQSREAVRRFLDTANPGDEFFLVDFSRDARVSVPFTADPESIRSRVAATRAEGTTALSDAVYVALQYMKGARYQRRALLLISDGGDNDSRYSVSEIRNIVRETDVWIYAIGIYQRNLRVPEEEPEGRLLTTLAGATGGRQFSLRDPNQMPGVAARIGLELRNQYVLGFSPSCQARDGKYHRLRVKVIRQRNLHVSARPGYYAPDPRSAPSRLKVE